MNYIQFICASTKAITVTFFLNETATTEIYTLSLHDALPIFRRRSFVSDRDAVRAAAPSTDSRRRSRAASPRPSADGHTGGDRKSTRLNSSHQIISYAVFCLKKKTGFIVPVNVFPASQRYSAL